MASSSSQPNSPSSSQTTIAPSSSMPSSPSSSQPVTPSSQPPSTPTSTQPRPVVNSPSQPSAPSSSQPLPVPSSSVQLSVPSSPRPVAPSLQRIALSPQNKEDCQNYLPLYKAILEGNLEIVRQRCDEDDHALEARITMKLDTALHVAVGTGRGNHIVKYLVNKMSADQVTVKNNDGNTVLSVAAIVGNQEAAEMILKKDEKNLSLVDELNFSGRMPLIEAARHGQKKMITYLLQFSGKYLAFVTGTKIQYSSGVSFINSLITAGFYDLTLELLEKYEGRLATKKLSSGESLLRAIAGKQSAFASGRRKRLASGRRKKLKFWQYLNLFKLRSHLREVREKKLKHDKALKLVKHLCEEITKNLDHEQASSILEPPLLLAAELGICEVVEEIIKSFPDAIWFTNDEKQNVFQLAVMNRQEELEDWHQEQGLNQLNLVPGAALQMQRELHWFK
ncbi:uncharacterized protein LOC116110866, partial [Pistacia vera]|uniref:uncharacterized protein LOC116110866 n=1 Tax=Pistacia vera TaxID=55513 RepID=UPI001263644F